MKFKYILIVLSVLQFGACSDDKGNYIYKEINELMVVENLEKGKLYTKVSFVDSLSFDPVIMNIYGRQFLKELILIKLSM